MLKKKIRIFVQADASDNASLDQNNPHLLFSQCCIHQGVST